MEEHIESKNQALDKLKAKEYELMINEKKTK